MYTCEKGMREWWCNSLPTMLCIEDEWGSESEGDWGAPINEQPSQGQCSTNVKTYCNSDHGYLFIRLSVRENAMKKNSIPLNSSVPSILSLHICIFSTQTKPNFSARLVWTCTVPCLVFVLHIVHRFLWEVSEQPQVSQQVKPVCHLLYLHFLSFSRRFYPKRLTNKKK